MSATLVTTTRFRVASCSLKPPVSNANLARCLLLTTQAAVSVLCTNHMFLRFIPLLVGLKGTAPQQRQSRSFNPRRSPLSILPLSVKAGDCSPGTGGPQCTICQRGWWSSGGSPLLSTTVCRQCPNGYSTRATGGNSILACSGTFGLLAFITRFKSAVSSVPNKSCLINLFEPSEFASTSIYLPSRQPRSSCHLPRGDRGPQLLDLHVWHLLGGSHRRRPSQGMHPLPRRRLHNAERLHDGVPVPVQRDRVPRGPHQRGGFVPHLPSGHVVNRWLCNGLHALRARPVNQGAGVQQQGQL
jgi:hypothetical protein